MSPKSGTVYLMGLVSQREGDAATEVARSTNGVQKVVRVFEYISEEEPAGWTAPTGPIPAPNNLGEQP